MSIVQKTLEINKIKIKQKKNLNYKTQNFYFFIKEFFR